jgi:hypothetical protein
MRTTETRITEADARAKSNNKSSKAREKRDCMCLGCDYGTSEEFEECDINNFELLNRNKIN